jgi:chromosome segregation ATPase
MRISISLLRAALPAAVAGVALVTMGCTDATTRDDVADAREELREEQADVAEARNEAQDEMAEAREEYTVGRPVTEDESAEAQQELADARQDANEEIAEEQADAESAKAGLQATQQDQQATAARDNYVKEVEQQLADIEAKIDELEEDASNAEGTEADNLNLRIETLQAQHDRAEEALGELKSADINHWQTHQEHVRTAMQDLNNSMNTVR